MGFDSSFYATVAQVIPVLLILLVVEFRVVDFQEWKPGDNGWLLVAATSAFAGVMATAVMGETAALGVLASSHATSTGDVLIVTALVSGAATVVAVPVLDGCQRWMERAENAKLERAAIVYPLALAVAVAATILAPLVGVVTLLVALVT